MGRGAKEGELSTTPTPLQERVAQLCDPHQGEDGANAVKIIAAEVGKLECEAAEAERLHIENLNLMRTIQQLRKALRRVIDTVEGDRMKNAIQAGKDLL